MTDLDYLKNIIDNAEDKDGDHEPSYLRQWPLIREKLEDEADALGTSSDELDKRYVRSGKLFAEWISDEYADINADDPWYWHIAEIANGQYPFEDLPEHVRDVAREMFY